MDDAILAIDKVSIVNIIHAADPNFVTNVQTFEAIPRFVWRCNPDIDIKVRTAWPSIANEHVYEYRWRLETGPLSRAGPQGQ